MSCSFSFELIVGFINWIKNFVSGIVAANTTYSASHVDKATVGSFLVCQETKTDDNRKPYPVQ